MTKFKSRLISHSNEQDVLMYPDRSSPTIEVHLIMTELAVAACHEDYVVGKLDV